MEKNTVTATIPFSFKGQEYNPSSIIDLDSFTKQNENFDFLFHQVASKNNIDRFSYEYEVLESSPILFSKPTGIATKFLKDNYFDLTGFIKNRSELEVQEILKNIASEQLNIESLEENGATHSALLKAYQAGRDSIIKNA